VANLKRSLLAQGKMQCLSLILQLLTAADALLTVNDDDGS
jgi:hypothetical protein